jgi:hypothetical protein
MGSTVVPSLDGRCETLAEGSVAPRPFVAPHPHGAVAGHWRLLCRHAYSPWRYLLGVRLRATSKA